MSGVGTEIAVIETTLREDRGAYDRDEGMQARYVDLIAQRDGVPTGRPETADSWRASADETLKEIPAVVVNEWKERPGGEDGFAATVRRVQDATMGVLLNIGDRALAMDFALSFEALPVSARSAVWREVGFGAPTFVKAADANELEAFKLLDGGPEFLEAWGRDAPRRAAIVYERFNRCVASMATSARREFQRWFWAITPAERRSVVWSLSGSADST